VPDPALSPTPGPFDGNPEAYRALVEATSALVFRWSGDRGYAEGVGWHIPYQPVGNDWLEMLHPDERDAVAAAWFRAQAEGRPARLEFRARTSAGRYRWCVCHAVPVKDARGVVTEWVGNLVDVQDEREAREALQRREKLEAVGLLTAGVAHDFNNLLTVITAGAETLVDRLPAGDPLRSEAELALHAADRGAQLVKQLLTICRQQPLSPRTVDVREALDVLAVLVRRTLASNIDVVVRQRDEPLYCEADPAQLDSVLLNLCINARDAMSAGGALLLEAERVHFTEEAAAHLDLRPGPHVMIAVRDTGTGMSADTIERALDPFFTTKPPGSGSGLGLSMAYGFVKQSGGHLAIASTPGQGSTIRMYFPAADTPQPCRDVECASHPSPTAGAAVLLVEDDPLVRAQVAAQLRLLGYSVTAAPDGRSALDVLATRDDLKLVMTDVAMPGGMDGLELAARAAQLRPDLPVLLTSGYTDDLILREGRLARSAVFLAKPYRRSQLADAVERALARRRCEPLR